MNLGRYSLPDLMENVIECGHTGEMTARGLDSPTIARLLPTKCCDSAAP